MIPLFEGFRCHALMWRFHGAISHIGMRNRSITPKSRKIKFESGFIPEAGKDFCTLDGAKIGISFA
jgi:hypothetical protein